MEPAVGHRRGAMLRLFGAPHVLVDGRPAPRLPDKFYALVSLLRLRFPGIATRGEISAILWEDLAPDAARYNLRKVLAQVRAWEDRWQLVLVTSDRDQVWRGPEHLASDLDAFRTIEHLETTTELQRFSSLYSGDFLRGLDEAWGEDLRGWIETHRTLLRDRFMTVALPAAGRLGGAVAEETLRRIAADAPYDDKVERALLEHLARESSPSAVEQEFESYRRRIAADLQQVPELETQALVATLLPKRTPAAPAAGEVWRSPIDFKSILAPDPRPVAATGGVPRVLLLPPPLDGLATARSERLLANALVDDITFTLCRMRSFSVFAPHSARQAALAMPYDAANLWGADYVMATRLLPGALDGELRLGFSLTRISTQQVLTGDTLAFRRDTLPARHAELAAAVVARVTGEIERAEIASFRKTGSASAYVHQLRGQEYLRIVELADLRRARKAFRRASELAPDFSPAIAMQARTLTLEWLLLGRTDRDLLVEAKRLATRAVAIDPLEASGHRELGHAALYMHALDESLDHLTRARSYSPHHADIVMNEADVLVHNSRSEDARPLAELAMQLNPLPPDEYYWIASTVHFLQRDYKKTLELIGKMKNPDPVGRLAAAAAAMLGDLDLAHRHRDKIMARQPDFRLAIWRQVMPLKSEDDKAHFIEALRRAGFS